MLCLSGFKLYSRWVPLINISCFLRQKSIVKRMFDQESCLFKLLGALFWQIQNLVCDLLCQLKSERSTCKYTKYTLLLRPISQVESVYICCGSILSLVQIFFSFVSTSWSCYYHTLPYPKTKEKKIWTTDKIEPQHIH